MKRRLMAVAVLATCLAATPALAVNGYCDNSAGINDPGGGAPTEANSITSNIDNIAGVDSSTTVDLRGNFGQASAGGAT